MLSLDNDAFVSGQQQTHFLRYRLFSRCVLSALAIRWPSLHRISPWFDEAFLVISLLVEAKFLSNHSCLLSESLYGLRRCRYGPKSGPPGERQRSEDARRKSRPTNL